MRIGNAEVLRVEEYHGLGFPPKAFLPDWDARLVDKHLHWMVPDHYAPNEGRLVGSIHSWVIKLPNLTVLVDTCSGNHKHRPDSPFFSMMNSPYLENLTAAGVDPDDVDFVFCTHLHIDHAGWNTRLLDGRWVPTFRNAKYVVSRGEFERLVGEGSPSADHLNLIADTIQPILESDQWLLIDAPFQLCDELYIETSPGHTSAHCHVTLSSGNEKAVFSGDIIHHPIQVYFPSWNSAACEAPEQAVPTRIGVLENLSETGTWLMPVHFARPFCCRVGRPQEAGFVCEME
ncbi:glyoxylase-like metal-dependent hydrolase (beta-lactamase superfamily II) [Rhizobium azooxidifex]|uniref:Glyoxylase-like metal-dependent hydrolase (Beta-lactamase superfamily II) n=1 Tax=Mycoplana azooxidifex TaxID=1636188 RepID=A0A7W6GKX8_9HYPH|nr:MBL fold metallo-hydrolase [Mycoplana azooxidifex]MBB3979546.1 glyoxylase-like metal-dependent hydrolase (beta-lactamase superfamily II) [Mycoplana azooxidifex]